MSALRPLILASASPRRREFLTAADVPFHVVAADVDESPLPGEPVLEMVKRLALLKGRHVAEQHPESWVLSADTMVSVDGHKLGKPEDTAEARKMLQLLSGRTHQVVGGFALINRGTNREIVHTVVTDVTMDVLSDYRINAYIATGEPMDKAGAYAIQGKGIQFVTSVKGSYSNVVGLPLAEVLQLLREHGIITA